jgi:predicted dinucleotide-binding enzyme
MTVCDFVFSIFRYGAGWAPFDGGSAAQARRVEPARPGNLRTRQKQSTCHWASAASRFA